MEVTSVSNLNFGLKIKKTETLKNLLSIWNKHFDKSSINYRLNLLRKSENNDYYIKFTDKNNDSISFMVGNIFEKSKNYTLPLTFIKKSTGKKEYYTPKYLTRKILGMIKKYKEVQGKDEPSWTDNLVYAAKQKAQLFV